MTNAPDARFNLDDELDATSRWDDENYDDDGFESGYADAPDDRSDVDDPEDPEETSGDLDLAARYALRRVAGLSTELEDITEVEYRQLRLERVVLVGVWTDGTVADAENSMAELALLAETAGSEVLEAIYQRRQSPDPATYIGRGKVEGLAEIVNEETGVATEDVKLEKSFTDDLDIDSISMMTIVVNAEEKFDVRIPDEEVKNLATVGDAVKYIEGAQN